MKTVIAILLLLPATASAAEVTCKRSPALIGKCALVKGSLGLAPGIGVTLIREDGSKVLITAPPGSNADIAPKVMQNWLYWQSKTRQMSTRMAGTYELCPLPAQPNDAGITEAGCINNGSKFTEDRVTVLAK
jgi:hypothetical protein